MGKGIQGGWGFPYNITDWVPFALARGLLARGFLNDNHATTSCIIHVRVQPRASQSRVTGFRDGALRVSVTAPPQDGRANAALLGLLADTLGIAKTSLSIVRGLTSRDKVVAVEGLAAGDIQRILEPRSHSPMA